jgi:predicted exporter
MTLQWRKRLFYTLLPLLIGLAVLKTTFKADLSAFFIAGDNAEEILLASEIQSGTLSRRYIISIGSANQEPVSADFIKSLIAALQKLPGIADVWIPGQERVTADVIQSYYLQHKAQLYSREPGQMLDKLLTEQGLQKRAEILKRALLSPQAATVKRIAIEDPLLLTLTGFKSIAGQMQALLNRDAPYQNLILETSMSGMDVVQQKQIQQQINRTFTVLNEPAAASGNSYTLEMTGVPIFVAVTQSLIEGDIVKVSILSSIALGLLFFWLFRSFQALFWVFSLLIMVVTLSVLMTNFVFGYVHGMTMALGTTLVGVCMDYPIHALIHARTVPAEQREATVATIWPSMLLGGLTTLVGYIALGWSGYPGFQQVSVYAGTGILVSLLLTRYILPGLIHAEKSALTDIFAFNFWVKFCNRFRPILFTGLVALSALGIAGLNSLQWMQDLEQLTPELNQLKANDKAIRSRMISVEPGRFILITAASEEAALQKAEQVYVVLDELQAQGDLSAYFGLYPWLLSARQQQYNQQLLNSMLDETVQQRWRKALADQGLSVSRLGMLDYAERKPLTIQKVLNTPIRRMLDSQIITTKEQTLLMIWIAEHNPEAVRAAFAEIESAQYFSQKDLLNQMAEDYQQRAQNMLLIGLLVIVLMLLLRYKNPLKTIQTLMPAVLAALWILAAWSLMGAAISFLHLVGFLLAVAICVDYGIFYQENRGGNIHLTYQAMGASMMTSAIAFGCLVVARTSALQTLAGVVAFGVILGFLFCPIIIRQPS